MLQPPTLPTYISIKDASRLVGLPVRALQERVRAGIIKAITLDGKVVVNQTDAKRSVPKEELPDYISLREAVRITGFSVRALQERIHAGTIRAITINGEIAVSKQSAIQAARQGVPKEKLVEYKQFEHLKGSPIWAAEAERRYGVLQRTLINWVKSGFIKRLGSQGNRVLLDEADVAYCVFVYKQTGGQGKRIFNPDGTPYTPKALQIA